MVLRAGTESYRLFDCRLGRVQIAKAGNSCLSKFQDIGDATSDNLASYDVIVPCDAPIAFYQNGVSGIADPGEYVVLHSNAAYEISSRKSLLHWLVTIPVSDLRTRIVLADEHLGKRFDQNRSMARMMRGMIGMMARTFSVDAPPNAEALATELISFVGLTLSSENIKMETSGDYARYRLKQRIFNYIDANLSQPNLSPKRIAADNRISVSHLYLIFNEERTTVSRFIQTKRLQRAYELIVADPNGAFTVSEIAYLVGFQNSSHFSRVFGQHFAMTPRDARHSGLPSS
ncbi:MAG: helix-turn-helix domain-containing protein [Mesorhizobium sp.]